MFERWDVTSEEFDNALETCNTDEKILAFMKVAVEDKRREAANYYLITERLANLDKEDVEEGVVAV
jgi:hypothetical protein